jgi:hypothetical protein
LLRFDDKEIDGEYNSENDDDDGSSEDTKGDQFLVSLLSWTPCKLVLVGSESVVRVGGRTAIRLFELRGAHSPRQEKILMKGE